MSYGGQPLTFRCTRCKRGYNYRTNTGCGTRFTTTGRTRRQKSAGMNYHNWGRIAVEYRCLDCGHVGWSRHPHVTRRRKHEQLSDTER